MPDERANRGDPALGCGLGFWEGWMLVFELERGGDIKWWWVVLGFGVWACFLVPVVFDVVILFLQDARGTFA